MARRRRAKKRLIRPDYKYQNVQVSRLINRVMQHGKKTTAERIVYSALTTLEQEARRPAVEVFEQALRNTMPMLEVRPRRVGGATYQVPTEVRPERRLTLALRWLVDAARGRDGIPMSQRLSQELLEAFRQQGTAVKRREDLHRMAEANRAFAHYRW
ncbi:MAG: 30S ribosomal protein S7 [Chloroflexi bacterium]|nr:30S ribosomal protein S7 [Chloroflexota bacterium]